MRQVNGVDDPVAIVELLCDAYLRTARAFGLITDAEIVQLIPARFLEGPH